MSAGPSQAIASLNLQTQAAHSARPNLAPPLRGMKRVINRAIYLRFFQASMSAGSSPAFASP
ncbi:MAG: hypothetical protein GX244_00380 [Firmicutes bacterium]|nr:hypothetical protein [Bacillota bacterium]